MSFTTLLAGANLAASGLSSWSTYQQGQFAATSARRQAQIYQQQAKFTEQQAGLKMAADDYNAVQLMGRLKVGAAASGIDPSVGAPEMLFEESAAQARINDIFTMYAANVKAANLEETAAITTATGEEERTAADVSAITGLISGGIESYGIYKGAYGTPGYGGAYGGPGSTTTAGGGTGSTP